MDQNEKAANVSDSDCIVNFTGMARVEGMMLWNCSVNLTTISDAGWSSMIMPSFMLFTNHSNQSFLVSVTVPRSASSNSKGTLIVHGDLSTDGLTNVGETKATIIVEPFLRLNITANVTKDEANAGEESTFLLDVVNAGNMKAPVVLVIPKVDGLKEQGWVFRLHPAADNISEGGWTRFAILIRSPGKLNLMTTRTAINITVAIQGMKHHEPVPYGSINLVVTVKADWGPVNGPLTVLMVIAVLIAVAVGWRSRRRRK